MGCFNRIEWLRLNGLLNGDFYGLFTAFVPTYTDFSRVYRLLATFIEFFDFSNVFWYCLNLLSFTDFYGYAP